MTDPKRSTMSWTGTCLTSVCQDMLDGGLARFRIVAHLNHEGIPLWTGQS